MTDAARARGALLGAFLADAAACGLHWIYDVAKLAGRGGDSPEFHPPAADHYHKNRRPGQLTHYGESALVLLRSLVASGGFDRADYQARFQAFFGAADYDGYVDHATRDTLANLEDTPGRWPSGADDDQIGAACKLVPLVIRYAGADDFAEVVAACVQATHANDDAVALSLAFARALALVLAGMPVAEAWQQAAAEAPEQVAERVRTALERAGESPVAAAGELGRACPLPQSLPSSVQAATHARNYRHGVRQTILAGGDSAGRAMLVGALLGAWHGVDGLPADWLARLEVREEVDGAVEALVRG